MTSPAICVCSLDQMERVASETTASHLVSLINAQMMPQTPQFLEVDNHLKLSMNDVTTSVSGCISPSADHIKLLVEFVGNWDQSNPMVIHCWAGISRSTAAAFIALCLLNPDHSEVHIAELIREKSSIASPNRLLVSCADQYLKRGGRMISAVDKIGQGEIASASAPFSLPCFLDDQSL